MKIRKLKCKYCGKEFTTTKMAQKFCSDICRYTLEQQNRCEKAGYEYMKKQSMSDQPCWDCKKYVNGCSWSRSFIPIEGWKAEKRILTTARKFEPKIETYRILYCPEFERG